jgi:hypothetical protein
MLYLSLNFNNYVIDTTFLIMKTHPDLWPSGPSREFPASALYIRILVCTSVTPAVPYLSTGLAGCSVGPGISRGACKLTRTPRVIKKNVETLCLIT